MLDWGFTPCVRMRTCIPPTHARASHASAQVLDWGFTELMPLSTLHSANHGYILDDTLQFTIQFERVTEGTAAGRNGRSTSSAAANRWPVRMD